ncbi:type III secretion system chaperone [Vibrio quintilis]|uniref:DspF/AvrF protein n=1 Tax=Vibrio quintilis TaxID=1117707 RepID=A0A1M7YSP6_9VIBR|nr:type III secretion system chaperone [Vibrio quintilis]SHO55644.1 DspF/AvrF protein [Vibrio quintilis]
MTPTQLKASQFIRHFGQVTQSDLSLKNGLCALYGPDNQEAAVIEVPDFSDNIIFHCALMTLPANISARKLSHLLQLNFEISAMQGCWLALNEHEQLNLCSVLAIETTSENHFHDTLTGFIELVKDVRAFVTGQLQQPDQIEKKPLRMPV